MSNDSTELSPSPGSRLRNYVTTPVYSADLAATRRIWSVPDVLATAGVFVFLTYLAVPDLLASAPAGRSPVPVHAGRHAGTGPSSCGLSAWTRIRCGAAVFTTRAPGNSPRCSPGVTTISNTCARSSWISFPLSSHLPRSGYTITFLTRSARVIGPDTGGICPRPCRCSEPLCGPKQRKASGARNSLTEHSRSSAEGQLLFRSLNERHPRYVRLALPTLFGASRPAVESFMSDADAA